jgi:hypothetical protein
MMRISSGAKFFLIAILEYNLSTTVLTAKTINGTSTASAILKPLVASSASTWTMGCAIVIWNSGPMGTVYMIRCSDSRGISRTGFDKVD